MEFIMKLGWREYLSSVIFKESEKKKETWEEESSGLFNILNNGNYKDDKNGVDVMVEEVNVNVNGDHVKDVVIEERVLVEPLEKLTLHNNNNNNNNNNDDNNDDDDDGVEVKNRVCFFYNKTGTCKFGKNCKFNHPSRKDFQSVGNKEKRFAESIKSVDDAEKAQSKYCQTPGLCKYRDAGRYNHSARKSEKEHVQLNFLGLPIRPLAQECKFYLQHGSCAYGTDCKFHHPEPSAVKEHESRDSLGNGNSVIAGVNLARNYGGGPLQSLGGSLQGTSVSPNDIILGNFSPYAPEMSSSHQTVPQTQRLNQSQVISSSCTNKLPLPHQVVNNVSKREATVSHCENPMQIGEFPEQPRQRDCVFFMKTGNCKHGLACRYNHPTKQMSKPSPPVSSKDLYARPPTLFPAQASQLLNSNSNYTSNNGMSSSTHQNNIQMEIKEFPERAGQPKCKSYMKTGQCKLKSACRYDHPRSRAPTSPYRSLKEKGLPLRPGVKLCRTYKQQGMCEYGHNCLYDHPEDHSPDVSVVDQSHSLTNVTPASSLAPPFANNLDSEWGDGWIL